MRYLVVLKSGIKITINELTKDELENIRNNHGSNVTVGFGTNGSFIERSEIAAIVADSVFTG
jgi:hypothetical protein